MYEQSVLGYMQLDSIEEGTKIYLYRMFRGEFICEEGLANVEGHAIRQLVCGRYDSDGKLSKTCKISQYEGEVWSSGGSDTVWFLKPHKRKAKNILRKLYEERYDMYQARADRMMQVIKEALQ